MKAFLVPFVQLFVLVLETAGQETPNNVPSIRKTCPIPGDEGNPMKMTDEIEQEMRRSEARFQQQCTDKDFLDSRNLRNPAHRDYVKSVGQAPDIFIFPARALFNSTRDGIHFIPGHAYFDDKEGLGWQCWFGYGGKEYYYNKNNDFYCEVLMGTPSDYEYVGFGPEKYGDNPAPPVNSVPVGIRTANGAVLEYHARTDYIYQKGKHAGFALGKLAAQGKPFYFSYDGYEYEQSLFDEHGKGHKHVHVLVCKVKK